MKGDWIVIGKLKNGVFLDPDVGSMHPLFWLFAEAHRLHAIATDKKDQKALKLIKEFCKSVDAEYLK